MAYSIPDTHKDLLTEPVVVGFTTMMPSGLPQTTPVWCSWDGTHIWVNTAKGRQKHENVLANPKVNILSIDPSNPYRYLEVRGEIVELTEDGAVEHINQLGEAYLGRSPYFGQVAPAENANTEVRVIMKIEPQEGSHTG